LATWIGTVRARTHRAGAPDLALREDNVKATMSQSRRSLDFFKREVRKRRIPYRRMISGYLKKAEAVHRQLQVGPVLV